MICLLRPSQQLTHLPFKRTKLTLTPWGTITLIKLEQVRALWAPSRTTSKIWERITKLTRPYPNPLRESLTKTIFQSRFLSNSRLFKSRCTSRMEYRHKALSLTPSSSTSFLQLIHQLRTAHIRKVPYRFPLTNRKTLIS